MKPLHIFKPGTHTAMNGASFDFSGSDIAATVHAYDPALHEAPAAGWAKSPSTSAHGLTAEPQQVDAAFAQQIAKGSYKKSPPPSITPTPSTIQYRACTTCAMSAFSAPSRPQ